MSDGAFTAPAENPDWVYGVALGACCWVVGPAMLVGLPELPSDVVGVVLVIGWIVLPVATYFDAQYVGAHGDWQPIATVWALGGLLPLANVLVAAAYLHRRWQAVGLPGLG